MSLFRKVLERLSRGRIVKRRISVGGRRGGILVTPDAQLKYLKLGSSAFDQDLIEIAEKYIGDDDTVWDIGANVGVFTFAAGLRSKTGTVLAVEPDNWLAQLLRRTAKFDDYAENNICVLSAAVSNENSVASFLIAERGRASNALSQAGGRSQMGGVRETLYVPTLTLDRLLERFQVPNFVKIDIEGAELMALESAVNLINDVRPKFYIEVGENVSSQIYTIFKAANYSCIDPVTHKALTHCVENTLFIPH